MVLSAARFRPGYRILADGADVTAAIAQGAGAVIVRDRSGGKSDTVEITLADTGPFGRFVLPRTGAVLEVALGYWPALSTMGRYIVDEIALSGPPHRMTITGRAAIHEETSDGLTELQTQKSRSFPAGTSLGELTEELAADHGLEPVISDALGAITLPHIDQINESDINLITRVAAKYGALAKPAGGKLVVAKRGASETAGGEPLPVVALGPGQVTNWSVTLSRREPAGSVIAAWRDLDQASDVEVEVGEGEPVRRLREVFPDEDAARAAAEAELERTGREGGRVTITMPGDTRLMAEGRLVLAGFRAGADREWLMTEVVHSLDAGGYRCTVQGELPEPEDDDE